MKKIRVLHYINQFYAQIGGEEAAGYPVEMRIGAVGPGRLFLRQKVLPNVEFEIVATIICGDNYFTENTSTALTTMGNFAKNLDFDLVVAGPAFNAGRYGMACGQVCKYFLETFSIPVLTGLYEENPAVKIFQKDVLIAKTGPTARRLTKDIENITRLAEKILCEIPSLDPRTDHFFTTGRCRNIPVTQSSAFRACDMLEAKFTGKPFNTEIPMFSAEIVKKAVLKKPLSQSKIILITDGGLYPENNPDNMPSVSATSFGIYAFNEAESLESEKYSVFHIGYDTSFVEKNPNRLVPVDAMRFLTQQRKVGSLHPEYLVTTGVATSLGNSESIGKGMAQYIMNHGIDAALLTST